MNFEPNTIYHIYNQGNNRQVVFFSRENYLFFIKKMRKHLLPYSDLLCYCLMPNHFHWLLYVNAKGADFFNANQNIEAATSNLSSNPVPPAYLPRQNLNHAIGTLLSSYTRAINIQENPVKAGLVNQATDWSYSSAQDFAGLRAGTLCNQKLAKELLLLP